MRKTQNRYYEAGRSMMEIIAVMAIMGVLLIGALIGFRFLLDYLKTKESAKQISTIGLRYKSERLGGTTKDSGMVSLKRVFPEGNKCANSPNDNTCSQLPDGGELRLYSYQDTNSFVVVTKNIKPTTCEEAILQGAFAQVTTADQNFYDFLGEGRVFTKEEDQTQKYFTADELRTNPEKLKDFCSYNIHLFIYGGNDSGKDLQTDDCYFYDGKCHNCPQGEIEDKNGNCCIETNLSCSLCGGCPTGKLCSTKYDSCVECLEDSDCQNPDRPYCSPDGTCKPCKHVGDPCRDSSGGVILGEWCNNDLECESHDCKESDGKYWDTSLQECICRNSDQLPIARGEACDVTTYPLCPDKCATGYDCIDNQCQCPNGPKAKVGEECNLACDSCEEGLYCNNGICEEANCTENGFTETRYLGDKCNLGCPCLTNALTCQSGFCRCGALPVKRNDPCWGECGCGFGLSCSSNGQDEGVCQCSDVSPKKDETCISECGCSEGLKCEQNKCLCLPQNSLNHGESCAGEDVCPNQCKNGTQCRPTGENGNKCCPEPSGTSCQGDIYDAQGCLIKTAVTCAENQYCTDDGTCSNCPVPNESCDISEDEYFSDIQLYAGCLKTKAITCEENAWCDDATCRECPNFNRSCNIKEDEYYPNNAPLYKGCLKTEAFSCPPASNSSLKVCDTNGTTCVGCNEDTDCEGDTYCDITTKTCKPCPTQSCEGIECCALDGDEDICGKKAPLSHKTTVTYTKVVEGECQTVTEDYCPLTDGEKPTNQCDSCNACQTWDETKAECRWLNPSRKLVCDEKCCSANMKKCCGTKCCNSSCNSDGTACCIGQSFGNKREYSDRWEWYDNSDFFVDSDTDMELSINVISITSFVHFSVYDKDSHTYLLDLRNGDVGTNISKTLTLEKGHTYHISLDFTNKCAACSIQASCKTSS